MPAHYHAGSALRDYLKPFLRTLGAWQADRLLLLSKGLLQSGGSILSEAGRKMLRRERKGHVTYVGRIDGWVRKGSMLLEHLPWDDFLLPRHHARLRERCQTWQMIVHDESDIAKPWAEKMEGLSTVRDGSTGEMVTGYKLQASIGIGKNPWDIHPIDVTIVDPTDEDFKSEGRSFQSQISRLLDEELCRDLLHVLDRGFDDEKWFQFFGGEKVNWLIRLRKKRNVWFRGEEHPLLTVAETLLSEQRALTVEDRTYARAEIGITLTHDVTGEKRKKPVRRMYGLVVVRHPCSKTPLLLLTSERLHAVKDAVRMYERYLDRWEIEDYLRFLKQTLSVEAMRLMTLPRLRGFLRLQMLLSDFLLREHAKGREPIGGNGTLWTLLQQSYVCREETRILSPYVVATAVSDRLNVEARFGHRSEPFPLLLPLAVQPVLFDCTELDRA